LETCISFLRGINVTGKNILKMPDLQVIYEELKFSGIRTYIQSGNVVFKAEKSPDNQDLSRKIEKRIFDKYNLNTRVIIKSVDELTNIIASNPFLQEENIPVENLYVTFLSGNPLPSDIENIRKYDYLPDRIISKNSEVYLYCPVSYGKTKFSNAFLEKKLNVKATTRNWKTVLKMIELANEK
jgi:uncharacterized protein (DUF1697 family)